MNTFALSCAVFVAVISILHSEPLAQAPPIIVDEPLVTRDEDGELTYSPDPDGYTFIDYSLCGYRSGKKRIPNVPVTTTVEPNADPTADDTERLQAVINATEKGAILFKKGTYRVKGTLYINKGGIVLRGEGNDAKKGTVIIATGTAERNLIVVTGNSKITVTNKQAIEGDFLTGSRTFKVNSGAKFEVGDLVGVAKTPNQKWVSDLGMDRIPPRPDGTPSIQWDPKDYHFTYERIVTEVDGDELTVDVGLPDSIQSKYGGGYIGKITQLTTGVEEVGIERMRITSEYKGDINKDEKHAVNAIIYKGVMNSWVADVITEHFVHSGVQLSGRSRFNTIQDCSNLDPASLITGGRRYAYSLEGTASFNQFIRLHSSNGRHDYVTGRGVPGPNVFYNSTVVKSHADIGPHHRWASGLLFDNIKSDGSIAAENRGNMGTGHGWSGVSVIYWNVKTTKAQICSPPVGANNYLIGVDAPIKVSRPKECNPGVIEDDISSTTIRSLYEAQLFARTGKKSTQLFPRRKY